MADGFEDRAKEAFVDDDFKLAVDLYTQAISLDPNKADLFADRAQANIKLNNFAEVVADANKAIELNPGMAKAYLRKGIACVKLEEYHTAKSALEIGASLAQNDARFTKLIKECDERIAEETASVGTQVSEKHVAALEAELSQNTQPEMALLKSKFRLEHYQKPEELVVTIYAKGIPKNNVTVDFGEQILSVTVDVPSDQPYLYQARLFAKIVPDKCRFEVMSTKIEIRLAKAEPINWISLEFVGNAIVAQKANVVGSCRPAYPSSKPKKKDWDKLEAQVKKEEKDEKLDGDAAVNKIFREIYQNADEDMRRAMSKSFVESNGTTLSTDWKDVGSKMIEPSAPEGMELRKWEF